MLNYLAMKYSPAPSPDSLSRKKDNKQYILELNYIKEYRIFEGFFIQGAPLAILKNIPFLLSDNKEGKIKENADFKYFRNRASFMENPVYKECSKPVAVFFRNNICWKIKKIFIEHPSR